LFFLVRSEIWLFLTLLLFQQGDVESPRELDPNTVPSLTNDYNVLVAVPAIHYLEHMVTGVRPYRARINFDGEKGSVLGANLMQGHTVSYEPDLNRIGFAESRRCQTGGSGGGGRTGAGSDGNEEESPEASDGSTSLTTSAGTQQQAAAAVNTGSSISVANDDDMFVAGGESSSSEESVKDDSLGGGGCFTAACRSFMAIGYVFIGTALAVVYRISRPKERLGADLLNQYTVEEAEALHQKDDLTPSVRRRAWNDDGPVMV
jgi:hypothetical protein